MTEWPLWRTDSGYGLYLVSAGPRIWLGAEMLQHMLDSMPLFPVALVSTDFTACPEGHYEWGPGAVGAVVKFSLDDGRRLVYRIASFDICRNSYELVWPD
jgi:hypothetical protein